MSRKRIAFTCILILVLTSLAFPSMVSASGGVGISPGKLEFYSNSAEVSQQLYVINTGTHRSSCRVFTEEDYQSWFDISEKDFTLEPQENKRILIKLIHPLESPSEYETLINVTSLPESKGAQYATGIKIPARISSDSPEIMTSDESFTQSSSDNEGIWGWIAVGICVLTALVSVVLIAYRRRWIGSS